MTPYLQPKSVSDTAKSENKANSNEKAERTIST
jgi:hypothetical protein